MKSKKTEILTAYVSKELKEKVVEYSLRKELSVSSLIEKLVQSETEK